MLNHKDNFKLWFCEVIDSLCKNENAGFPILMITFPLLERYLRSKSRTGEDEKLKTPFFNELIKIFPVLRDEPTAKQFWQVYRNGILHQATLSQKNIKGVAMPNGWLSGVKNNAVEIDGLGHFWVNPVEFAKKVIDTINNDFSSYEAKGSPSHTLATVQSSPLGYSGTRGDCVGMFGTSGRSTP